MAARSIALYGTSCSKTFTELSPVTRHHSMPSTWGTPGILMSIAKNSQAWQNQTPAWCLPVLICTAGSGKQIMLHRYKGKDQTGWVQSGTELSFWWESTQGSGLFFFPSFHMHSSQMTIEPADTEILGWDIPVALNYFLWHLFIPAFKHEIRSTVQYLRMYTFVFHKQKSQLSQISLILFCIHTQK